MASLMLVGWNTKVKGLRGNMVKLVIRANARTHRLTYKSLFLIIILILILFY